MVNTQKASYEKKLKESLSCFHCGESMKNMPSLKEHLQKEWERLANQERLKFQRREKQRVEASSSQEVEAKIDI
jgi:aprataxin